MPWHQEPMKDVVTVSYTHLDVYKRQVCEELGAHRLDVGTELPTVVDLLAASGVVASKSAARRAIEEGGAYLNNEKVTNPDARVLGDQLLHGRYVVTRRGKRTVGAVELAR